MPKAKAMILGGSILLALTYFAASSVAGPPSPTGVIKNEISDACQKSIDVQGCEVVAGLIQPFVGYQEIGKILGIKKQATCEECVDAVTNFEVELGLNGTAQNIAETLHQGCIENFPDAVLEQQCEYQVDGDAPNAIENLLETFPPSTACSSNVLNFCP